MKSMRTAGCLGNIRTLFETGSTVGLPDDVLLDNFATHRRSRSGLRRSGREARADGPKSLPAVAPRSPRRR